VGKAIDATGSYGLNYHLNYQIQTVKGFMSFYGLYAWEPSKAFMFFLDHGVI
jgi:hypothetical protein